jgi:hypothetical protein
VTVKIPVAETVVDGRIVFVDPFTVVDGMKCVCPECRGPVVHRREGHERSDVSAPVMRDPCFAHVEDDYVTRRCHGGAGESHRHRQAKLMAAYAVQAWSLGAAMQPCFVYACACGASLKRVDVEKGDAVIVDARAHDANIGRLEPDVFVRQGDGGGAIEIYVASPMTAAKIEAYKTLSWWVELDAASILSGSIEWKVRRASWLGPCAGCEAIRKAKRARQAAEEGREVAVDDGTIDPLMLVRRKLAALPIEVRASDVCYRCGQHTISNEAARLQFFASGGSTTCGHCGITKTCKPYAAAGAMR